MAAVGGQGYSSTVSHGTLNDSFRRIENRPVSEVYYFMTEKEARLRGFSAGDKYVGREVAIVREGPLP